MGRVGHGNARPRNGLWLLWAIPSLLLVSGEATAKSEGVAGTWHASYRCVQGETAATITLAEQDGELRGRFRFYAPPGNPTVPDGEFEVFGNYDPVTGLLSMRPGNWLEQPMRYRRSGFTATVPPGADEAVAQLDLRTCGPMRLVRDRTKPPTQPQVAEARPAPPPPPRPRPEASPAANRDRAKREPAEAPDVARYMSPAALSPLSAPSAKPPSADGVCANVTPTDHPDLVASIRKRPLRTVGIETLLANGDYPPSYFFDYMTFPHDLQFSSTSLNSDINSQLRLLCVRPEDMKASLEMFLDDLDDFLNRFSFANHKGEEFVKLMHGLIYVDYHLMAAVGPAFSAGPLKSRAIALRDRFHKSVAGTALLDTYQKQVIDSADANFLWNLVHRLHMDRIVPVERTSKEGKRGDELENVFHETAPQIRRLTAQAYYDKVAGRKLDVPSEGPEALGRLTAASATVIEKFRERHSASENPDSRAVMDTLITTEVDLRNKLLARHQKAVVEKLDGMDDADEIVAYLSLVLASNAFPVQPELYGVKPDSPMLNVMEAGRRALRRAAIGISGRMLDMVGIGPDVSIVLAQDLSPGCRLVPPGKPPEPANMVCGLVRSLQTIRTVENGSRNIFAAVGATMSLGFEQMEILRPLSDGPAPYPKTNPTRWSDGKADAAFDISLPGDKGKGTARFTFAVALPCEAEEPVDGGPVGKVEIHRCPLAPNFDNPITAQFRAVGKAPPAAINLSPDDVRLALYRGSHIVAVPYSDNQLSPEARKRMETYGNMLEDFHEGWEENAPQLCIQTSERSDRATGMHAEWCP